MSKQTAIQQLINYLDPIHSAVINKAIELLKTEEEQIINAYFEGFREGRGIDKIDISDKIFIEDTNAEKYYETTYQPSGSHSPKEI